MDPDVTPHLPGNGVHYLVTVTWRGKIHLRGEGRVVGEVHVDPLRVFAREADARAYAAHLESTGDATPGQPAVLYECRGDRPPRRLKL